MLSLSLIKNLSSCVFILLACYSVPITFSTIERVKKQAEKNLALEKERVLFKENVKEAMRKV